MRTDMRKKLKVVVPVLIIAAIFATITYLASTGTVSILDPKGSIANEQRNLIYIALGLMLLVVVPVFALTGFIAWKYREGNKKAIYDPTWDHNTKLEAAWWGIPFAIIMVLAGITWVTSHTLDPYKPIASTKDPLSIQVVALQYKWLFIYPGQHVATVNYVQLPKDTPVTFTITADAPMNSFWIPQLGGQVYAMAGMKTKLHLMADEQGSYRGSSANLSGKDFADMTFTAEVVDQAGFDGWVKNAQQSRAKLTAGEYNALAKAETKVGTITYSAPAPGLYDTVVMKYMAPAPAQHGSGDEHGGHQ